MKSFNNIQNCLTSQSLVLLDEPMSTTSVDDGSALAYSICVKLQDSHAFVFCATHFPLLTKLADVYYNVTK